MQTIRRVLKNQRGFTLIEMLVVVAIMAILMAIIVPRVTNAFSNSQVQADQANKKLLQTAVERYYMDHTSTYPLTGTTSTSTGSSTPDTGTIDVDALLSGHYIDQTPTDPWNAKRAYLLNAGIVQVLGAPTPSS